MPAGEGRVCRESIQVAIEKGEPSHTHPTFFQPEAGKPALHQQRKGAELKATTEEASGTALASESPDIPSYDDTSSSPPILGYSASSSLVASQTAAAGGLKQLLLRPLNWIRKKVRRDMRPRPTSPAESIQNYQPPAQHDMKPIKLKYNMRQYSDHTASDSNDSLTEEVDCATFDRAPSRPKAIGSPAATPNAYVVPSKATDGSFWLYLRNPSITWKGGREGRPASPAESIHSYQAPLQCGMKQRPTHLKCNLMRYSDHTLPCPPVTPQQTAVFPSVVVQCQESTVGTVDRLWSRTPPQNWSSPGSHVTTPLAVAFKAQPLLLQAQNSIAEDCLVEVFTPPPEYQEVQIQKNAVAAMAQVLSSSNGDDSAMEKSSLPWIIYSTKLHSAVSRKHIGALATSNLLLAATTSIRMYSV